MEISKSWFIVIIAIFVSLTLLAVAVAFNIGGIGAALAGFGGPLAAGLYEIFAALPKWSLSGGWPTLAASIFLVVALMFAAGYLFEEKHIIASITGKNAQSTVGTFQDSPSQTIPIKGLQDQPTKKE